jgi:hypothetical protein
MRDLKRGLAFVVVLLSMLQSAGFAAEQRRRASVRRVFKRGAPVLPGGPIVRIQNHQHMSEAAYSDLRDASIALMKRYPPSQNVYVGLGRDPAPFIAFLQAIGATALNFPASGGYFSKSEELDRHFEKLIPKSVRQGNRTLVLLDQTSSGKTHAAMMPLLRSYLHRTGSKVQVRGVAFYEAARVSRRIKDLETIDVRGYPEVGKFLYEPYEGIVSPYERHVPGQDNLEDLTFRPQYDRFKAAIVERAKRDAKLDRFLTGFAAGGRRQTRSQAWKLRSPHRKGLPSLKPGPLLTVGDDELPVLDKAGYAALSETARRFLDRYPPSDGRFYLGIGRSATPILAFLENLGTPSVGYLAVDGLDEENHNKRAEKTALDRYVAAAVPLEVLKKHQPITLFQSADTGHTLEAVKDAIERYAQAKGSRSRVEMVSLAKEEPSNGVEGVAVVSTRAMLGASGKGYRAASPYAYHKIGKHDLSDLTPRRAYTAFKASLLERMRRDGDLDTFLHEPE